MGLFDKKYCDICGDKIGFLGNRKLEDGDMCKNCAALLSPFNTERRKTTLSEIKEHLAYRENNKTCVSAFHATRSIGSRTKVILDEDAGKFIVTSSGRWQSENPDVMDFSQVTDCRTEIRESKTEIKRKDKDGKDVSFNPPRYDIDYDFYITVQVNSPWFNEIGFKINDSRVDREDSTEFREANRQANEIKEALMLKRAEVRESATATVTHKKEQICHLCGATTTPDANGRCEFCDGEIK